MGLGSFFLSILLAAQRVRACFLEHIYDNEVEGND